MFKRGGGVTSDIFRVLTQCYNGNTYHRLEMVSSVYDGDDLLNQMKDTMQSHSDIQVSCCHLEADQWKPPWSEDERRSCWTFCHVPAANLSAVDSCRSEARCSCIFLSVRHHVCNLEIQSMKHRYSLLPRP